MKVAVIGAGAAGLCAVKHCLSFKLEVVAFEQSDKIGGTWNYSESVGQDIYGNDVHSSMYKGLQTNLPKELMAFPDYPFPPSSKSFLCAIDIVRYLNDYTDKFNLRSHIKFQHHVLRIRPLASSQWELIVLNFPKQSYEKHIFDNILVCNGHFNVPNTPHVEGENIFEGGRIHSHYYREPSRYAGLKVLTVGGGPSGVDITQEIATTAQKVYWSNHLSPPKILRSPNIVQKPDVKELTLDGAKFSDGSTEQFNEIVYCTGYKYTFPFLSVDCGVLSDGDYVRPLYKHCLSINNPSMGLIGLPVYVCPFQMFDLQIRFCLKFMTGDKQLPSMEEMFADTDREITERFKQGLQKGKVHAMSRGYQDKYFAELATLADTDPIKPVILKMYYENRRNQEKDFANYRKYRFTILDDENYECSL